MAWFFWYLTVGALLAVVFLLATRSKVARGQCDDDDRLILATAGARAVAFVTVAFLWLPVILRWIWEQTAPDQ